MSWREEMFAVLEERFGSRPEARREVLSDFVLRRSARLGLDDPRAYLRRLRAETHDGDELSRLVPLVTNGFTWFYRDALQLEIAEELLAQRARSVGEVHVWSAGCSTGEEAYSLAIACHQAGIAARIVATDLNGLALARARRGVYDAWSLRHLPEAVRESCFRHRDSRYHVIDAIAAMVEFREHNLVGATLPRSPGHAGWDLIVCRNVLIYFRSEVSRAVLERAASTLSVGGWLLLGASDLLGAGGVRGLECTAIRGRRAFKRPVERAARRTAVEPVLEVQPRSVAGPAAPLEPRRTKNHPDEVVALLSLANRRAAEGELDPALAAYAEAEAREPLLAEVPYLRALMLRGAGRLHAARGSLRRALFLDAELWPAWFLLAGVLRRLGDDGRARAALQAARAALAVRKEVHFLSELGALEVDAPCAAEVRAEGPGAVRTGRREDAPPELETRRFGFLSPRPDSQQLASAPEESTGVSYVSPRAARRGRTPQEE